MAIGSALIKEAQFFGGVKAHFHVIDEYEPDKYWIDLYGYDLGPRVMIVYTGEEHVIVHVPGHLTWAGIAMGQRYVPSCYYLCKCDWDEKMLVFIWEAEPGKRARQAVNDMIRMIKKMEADADQEHKP